MTGRQREPAGTWDARVVRGKQILERKRDTKTVSVDFKIHGHPQLSVWSRGARELHVAYNSSSLFMNRFTYGAGYKRWQEARGWEGEGEEGKGRGREGRGGEGREREGRGGKRKGGEGRGKEGRGGSGATGYVCGG